MALILERPAAANAVQAAKARQAATRPRRLPVSDLKRRGWTDAMVSRLLGKPDASERGRYSFASGKEQRSPFDAAKPTGHSAAMSKRAETQYRNGEAAPGCRGCAPSGQFNFIEVQRVAINIRSLERLFPILCPVLYCKRTFFGWTLMHLAIIVKGRGMKHITALFNDKIVGRIRDISRTNDLKIEIRCRAHEAF